MLPAADLAYEFLPTNHAPIAANIAARSNSIFSLSVGIAAAGPTVTVAVAELFRWIAVSFRSGNGRSGWTQCRRYSA